MVHLIAPGECDPDDALDARWLRDHDGVPAMEMPHPEQEARDIVLDSGHWLPVTHAGGVFAVLLDAILEEDLNETTPY